jgi:hypothetical protein
MSKMDITKTFKVDEEFEQYLSKLVVDLDWTLSSVIRQSIIIAAPFLRVHPRHALSIGLPENIKQ